MATGAVTLERLEAMTPVDRGSILLAEDALVAGLPRLDLDSDAALRVSQGQPVAHVSGVPPGLARIYGPAGEFMGVVDVTDERRIVPRRLVAKTFGAGARRASIA